MKRGDNVVLGNMCENVPHEMVPITKFSAFSSWTICLTYTLGRHKVCFKNVLFFRSRNRTSRIKYKVIDMKGEEFQ